MLEIALAWIESDGGRDAHIVFLGDYVDRGPDSAGVIERLQQGMADGRNWTCLLGNHDRMFRLFMESPPRSDPQLKVGWDWFHPQLGGRQTLESYGLKITEETRLFRLHAAAKDIIPAHHIAFLNSLVPYHLAEDHLFVHAGIKPGVALDDQTEDDLIWIRRQFHDVTDAHPWLVVHGHTPVDAATHYGNRVNLDTGAGFGYPLSVAVFDGPNCHLVTQDGRVSLVPQVG